MAINIGRTGTAGRFIGGGAGVYRSTQMKFYVDPFKYGCWTGESDSSMVDLSGWGNDVTVVNGATTRTNGWWSFDGTDDFAKRALDSDFSFSSWVPLGAGKSLTIASNILSIPSPVLPEQPIAIEVSIPITSSISFFVFSKSEAGKSILFKIGITS